MVTDVGLFLDLLVEEPDCDMKRAYTDEHAAAGVDAPLPEIETWPNQYRRLRDRDRHAGVHLGLPEDGPAGFRQARRCATCRTSCCLELKSLKMYLLAYRNLGIFQENVVNRVSARRGEGVPAR